MAEVKIESVTTRKITLTLTEEEASILAYLSGCFTGDPRGPRGVMDDIYRALGDAEVLRKIVPYTGGIDLPYRGQ